jgi:hypothetical protein
MKRIKGFEEHRKKRRRRKRSDGSVEQVHRLANDAYRDWQSDAYRGQSGRREADVPNV